MNPTQFVIWVFLAVFVSVAILGLGSLPGWIKLPDAYRKTVFRLVILEVVTVVCGFGAWAFKSIKSPEVDLKTVLLSAQYGWDWQYAPDGMRATLRFQRAEGGKITMDGETYAFGGDKNRTLKIKWRSTEPFDVPANAKTVTFKAQREYTEEAAKLDPALRWEVGKKIACDITVHTILGLEGISVDDRARAQPWGLVMTPAYP